jgi:hypothetical protein
MTIDEIQFLAPTEGTRGSRRVRVKFPDGCETALPNDKNVTLAEILESHAELHRHLKWPPPAVSGDPE